MLTPLPVDAPDGRIRYGAANRWFVDHCLLSNDAIYELLRLPVAGRTPRKYQRRASECLVTVLRAQRPVAHKCCFAIHDKAAGLRSRPNAFGGICLLTFNITYSKTP